MIFILKMNYSSNKNTQKVINSQIREYFNFKIQIWKLQTKVKRQEILEQNMLLEKKKMEWPRRQDWKVGKQGKKMGGGGGGVAWRTLGKKWLHSTRALSHTRIPPNSLLSLDLPDVWIPNTNYTSTANTNCRFIPSSRIRK